MIEPRNGDKALSSRIKRKPISRSRFQRELHKLEGSINHGYFKKKGKEWEEQLGASKGLMMKLQILSWNV